MVANNRIKKRVRIQAGHQARYIENRNSSYNRKKSKSRLSRSRIHKSSRRAALKTRFPDRVRTHRPSVSELVYQYLERASNRNVARNQKTNAPNQFRKLQRRRLYKKIKPDDLSQEQTINNDDIIENDDYFEGSCDLPFIARPKTEGNINIEKCIFEVLTFATALGLLVPADEKGMTFRVASDIKLFNKDDLRRIERKRKAPVLEEDIIPPKRRC